jgi:hypothetical protein
MSTTTLQVSTRNRDRLAAIAASELNGSSLDSALEMLLFEHESAGGLARLSPERLAEICREAQTLAETDIAARVLDA